MKLFVGIDVSSEKLDVCFLDSSDTTLKEVTLPNNLNGASSIKESVLTFHHSRYLKGVRIEGLNSQPEGRLEWSPPLFTVFILPHFYLRTLT